MEVGSAGVVVRCGDGLTFVQVAAAVGCLGFCREPLPEANEALHQRGGVGHSRLEASRFDDGDLDPEGTQLSPARGGSISGSCCPEEGRDGGRSEGLLVSPPQAFHHGHRGTLSLLHGPSWILRHPRTSVPRGPSGSRDPGILLNLSASGSPRSIPGSRDLPESQRPGTPPASRIPDPGTPRDAGTSWAGPPPHPRIPLELCSRSPSNPSHGCTPTAPALPTLPARFWSAFHKFSGENVTGSK